MASILTLFALIVFPSLGMAQKGTKEARNKYVLICGQPEQDGRVRVEILMTKDEGQYNSKAKMVIKNVDFSEILTTEADEHPLQPDWINSHDTVAARPSTSRKSIHLTLFISIGKELTPVQKAGKIANRVEACLQRIEDAVLIKCPECEHHAIVYDFTEDLPRTCANADCDKLIQGDDWTKWGPWELKGARCSQLGDPAATQILKVENSESWTIRVKFTDGYSQSYRTKEKDWATPKAFAGLSFDEADVLCSYDLEGTPEGGRVTVGVDGEELFSLDTGMFTSASEIEDVLSLLISDHPLMLATVTDQPIETGFEDDAAEFDGSRIEFLVNGAESFMLYVEDEGLDVSYNFGFDLRADSVGSSYCLANVNSTGFAGELWARGSEEVSDNYLVLHAENVPNQFGIFFAGPNQIQMPFGEGYRCVGGSVMRIGGPLLPSGNQVTKVVDLDLLSPELLDQPLNIQYWHRDPLAGGSNFNLSGAISLNLFNTVAPL